MVTQDITTGWTRQTRDNGTVIINDSIKGYTYSIVKNCGVIDADYAIKVVDAHNEQLEIWYHADASWDVCTCAEENDIEICQDGLTCDETLDAIYDYIKNCHK